MPRSRYDIILKRPEDVPKVLGLSELAIPVLPELPEMSEPLPEAGAAARTLEDKAMRCIYICQKLFPDREDSFLENTATEFMNFSEEVLERIKNAL